MFFARVFLSRRNAAFDAAVGGVLGAVAKRSVLPLGAAAPYLWSLGRFARSWTQYPTAAPVILARDAVGLFSLTLGSVRSRSVVL
jgi:hypothetical protein